MAKFAFSVPNVQIVVEAADRDEAYDRVEQLLPINGKGSITSGESIVDSRAEFYRFEVRHVSGRPEPLRCCVVCGCTDEAACKGGCYWVTANLCSGRDEAHYRIGVAQGEYF